MRKICPFMQPWPFAMIAPKRLEFFNDDAGIQPAGDLMAVTELPGRFAKNSSPSSPPAARVARARSRAFRPGFHADFLMYQRFGERQNQRGGRRPTGFARIAALLFLLQIEVIVGQRGAFR